MKLNTPILIFAYSFPHKKTFDFISLLASKGFSNLFVIGAPKIKLTKYSSANNTLDLNFDVRALCSSLNIPFLECKHDDKKSIIKAKNHIGANIAIISGARILKENIIELFSDGVVNFHPGKIPETSGLDSYFYTIKSKSSMGTTVHLIDKKVDAGRFIFFEKLRIDELDTFDTLREKLYLNQLNAFSRYLDLFFGNKVNYKEINRPKKNEPLTELDKEQIKSNFNSWHTYQIALQKDIEINFFKFCETGNLNKIKKIISENTYLINQKNINGWSAIIIAAFWQHEEVVKYLLEIGANPNDKGKKGTTVLMYAKTKLLETQNPSLNILALLLSKGADVMAQDVHGKDIFYYLDINTKSGKIIENFLKTKMNLLLLK